MDSRWWVLSATCGRGQGARCTRPCRHARDYHRMLSWEACCGDWRVVLGPLSPTTRPAIFGGLSLVHRFFSPVPGFENANTLGPAAFLAAARRCVVASGALPATGSRCVPVAVHCAATTGSIDDRTVRATLFPEHHALGSNEAAAVRSCGLVGAFRMLYSGLLTRQARTTTAHPSGERQLSTWDSG